MAGKDVPDHPVTGSLPLPLNPLIDRIGELAALRAMFGDSAVRLVTLIGPAGVGKTHLGLQAAYEASPEFTDGVHLVRLSDLSNPSLVMPAILRALGIVQTGQEWLQQAHEVVGDRTTLLLLDNFEHLLPAASSLADLLKYCVGVKALVTSRAPLNISGEHIVTVSPLELPAQDQVVGAADLMSFPALKLFLDRALAAVHDFAPTDEDARAISEVCRRLDGLPLAIELAAARTVTLSPSALLRQIENANPSDLLDVLAAGPRDVDPRLQTMREAVAWSYASLSSEEQALFRRLSVFAGGFTLDTAKELISEREAGTGYPLDGGQDPVSRPWEHLGRDVADTDRVQWITPALPPIAIEPAYGIGRLQQHSLVQRLPTSYPGAEERFGMLVTIRSFARDQLAAADEDAATLDAHAAWALRFAEVVSDEMWERDQTGAANRIEAELDNLRAALTWAESQGEVGTEVGLRLAATLWLFWQIRGFIREGRSCLELMLARPDGPRWDRAVAQVVAGILTWAQGDLDQAEGLLLEALAFWKRMEDHAYYPNTLLGLALVSWSRGDIPHMVTLTGSALQRFNAVNNAPGAGICLIMFAIVAMLNYEFDRARLLLDDASAQCSSVGFHWGTATSRLFAGEVERRRGQWKAATQRFTEAMDSYYEQGDPWGTSTSLAGLASVGAAVGQTAQAARLFGAADAWRARSRAFSPLVDLETIDGSLEHTRTRLKVRFQHNYVAGERLKLDEAIALGNQLSAAVRMRRGPRASGRTVAGVAMTAQESRVLEGIVAGNSDPEIAAAMKIGVRTVEKYASALIHKYGARRRAELIAQILREEPGYLERPQVEGR